MSLPSVAGVQSRIHTLPGRPPFMTVYDLADFYQVTPHTIMKAVRRNMDRFPDGFIFDLTDEEVDDLVAQNGRPNKVNRGVLVGFTKKGSLQLSSVLTGPVADAVSVIIINAFDAMDTAQAVTLRRAAFKLESAYIGRSAMKMAIKRAAADGRSFDQLWGWHDWPKLKLAETIEEMRALGYIPQTALFVPPYVFAEARRVREMANLKAHVDDNRQMHLGLEG